MFVCPGKRRCRVKLSRTRGIIRRNTYHKPKARHVVGALGDKIHCHAQPPKPMWILTSEAGTAERRSGRYRFPLPSPPPIPPLPPPPRSGARESLERALVAQCDFCDVRTCNSLTAHPILLLLSHLAQRPRAVVSCWLSPPHRSIFSQDFFSYNLFSIMVKTGIA